LFKIKESIYFIFLVKEIGILVMNKLVDKILT